jgi:hypothetical protein
MITRLVRSGGKDCGGWTKRLRRWGRVGVWMEVKLVRRESRGLGIGGEEGGCDEMGRVQLDRISLKRGPGRGDAVSVGQHSALILQ